MGISFSILLKADGIGSIINILKIYFSEIFIIIPSFLYLTYQTIIFSLGGSKQFNYQDKDKYLNKLYLVMLLICISSLIVSINGKVIQIT